MPQMGISVSEGTILEWRKQPGDWVEADETIADVTTDKVDVEIPSPASGRLARILVEPGETVAVGAPIAEIDAGARAGRGASARSRTPTRSLVDSSLRGRAGSLRLLLAGRAADRRQARRRPRARSRAPGSAGGCARRTCSPTSRRRGNGQPKPRSPSCTPSRRTGPTSREPSDEQRASRATASAREPMSPMRQAIAQAHGREPPDRGALHDDRRGRHVAGRGAARAAEGVDGPARRAAHLPRVRRPGDGRGARATTRSSTRRSTATRSSTTTTSTSGSRSRSTRG